MPPFRLDVTRIPAGLVAEVRNERTILVHGMATGPAGTETIDLRVTDAVGQTASATASITLVTRSLTLVSPVGGEFLPRSGRFPVRWAATGELGTTVRIAYNTDGSAVDFPFTAADAWPIEEDYPWLLPDADIPACRLRITAVQYPTFRAVSGVFTITSPTIEVLAPTGRRCVRTGASGEILWESVGNLTRHVDIHYNTDGSDTEFPFTMASAIEDTGRFIWPAPATPIESCRVRVCSTDAALCGVSAGTFAIADQCGIRMLLFSRYADQTAAERLIQTSSTVEPDLSYDTTGEVPNRGHFAGLDALVCCPEGIDPGEDPLSDGSRLLNAGIMEFISAGGALVAAAPGDLTLQCLSAATVLPAPVAVDAAGTAEVEVTDPIHPLTAGVPRRFTAPGALWSFGDSAADTVGSILIADDADLDLEWNDVRFGARIQTSGSVGTFEYCSSLEGTGGIVSNGGLGATIRLAYLGGMVDYFGPCEEPVPDASRGGETQMLAGIYNVDIVVGDMGADMVPDTGDDGPAGHVTYFGASELAPRQNPGTGTGYSE